MRRRRPRPAAMSACSAWRSRPSPKTRICTTSSARTSSWRSRFAEAEPHYSMALDRCDAARRLAPRPRAAHPLHLEEARPLRCGDGPGRGRDAALAGLARLLLHPRRPAARLGRGAARSTPPRCLPMIESSWLRALEIGEQPELQDTVRGRGSFLAAHNLAVLHASLGAARRGRALARARGGASRRGAAARSDGPPEADAELAGGAASFPAFARGLAAYPFAMTSSGPACARRARRAHHGPRPSDPRPPRLLARAPARPPPLAGRAGAGAARAVAAAPRASSSRRAACTATGPTRWPRCMP